MLTFARRAATSLAVIVVAFVAGRSTGAFGDREARAQSLSTSSITVPEGGLVFRAPDGTPLARLARGSHGATFVLYDEHQRPSTPGSLHDLHVEPYTDDADPWTSPGSRTERPGPGF